jgi:hypothetical protein
MLFALSPVSTLIQHLIKTPQKFLSATDRFYFLRWLICSEVDADYHEKLEQLDAAALCPCGMPCASRIRPWGRAGTSLCSKCFFADYGSTSAWRSLVHPPLLTQDVIDLHLDLGRPVAKTVSPLLPASDSHNLVVCPFCQLGPASTHHWLIWCPVVGLVFTKSIGKVYDISLFTSPDTPSSVLTALIKAVANLRRHLLSVGCLSLPIETRPFSHLVTAAHHWHGPDATSASIKHFKLLDAAVNQVGAVTRRMSYAPCFPGLEDDCLALRLALRSFDLLNPRSLRLFLWPTSSSLAPFLCSTKTFLRELSSLSSLQSTLYSPWSPPVELLIDQDVLLGLCLQHAAVALNTCRLSLWNRLSKALN